MTYSNAAENPYSDWNYLAAGTTGTKTCFKPLEAVIPVCMKLRCPPITPQVGRDITYSIDSTEFIAAGGIYEEGARADFSCQGSVGQATYIMVYPNPLFYNGFNKPT
jgi:hypothetical protein